jgi:hypothetical protein
MASYLGILPVHEVKQFLADGYHSCGWSGKKTGGNFERRNERKAAAQ